MTRRKRENPEKTPHNLRIVHHKYNSATDEISTLVRGREPIIIVIVIVIIIIINIIINIIIIIYCMSESPSFTTIKNNW
ncbi:hypothetical protein ANN_08646 [Periplaneta americana]|uniref:Uncharacterized protein n=1 Tax=Periplaneta americana TaxID=6978 RepID=A0ABQ8T487_PERAM|nr:hypothetical protein ANN_08646 [Periplaneta americana]